MFPQDIGMIVNDFLIENFSEIVDYNFTADVEEQFDKIAEGKLKWTGMLHKFYSPFHKTIEETLEKKSRKANIRVLGNHPETGEQVSVRMGRFGPVAQIGNAHNGRNPICQPCQKSAAGNNNSFRSTKSVSSSKIARSHEGDEMVVGIGRFGPYVRYRSKFYSLKKGVDDPYSSNG